MFKVNNKNTFFFRISIVDFEQVSASWKPFKTELPNCLEKK